MKAKDFLKDLLRWDLATGSAYMKSSCELKIISGELKPRSLYYFSFKKSDLMAEPDVTFTLGGGDVLRRWGCSISLENRLSKRNDGKDYHSYF